MSNRFIFLSVFVVVISHQLCSGQQPVEFSYQQPAACYSGHNGCQVKRTPAFPSLCDATGCGNKNWVDIDFIQYWSNGFRAPALVSDSPAGTPTTDAGVLGIPGTNVLLGNGRIGGDSFSGVRVNFGRWLDDCGKVAITGSIFALGDSTDQTFPGDSGTIVSRPFFNADPAVNAQDSELVNFPGVVSGTLNVSTDTDIFSASVGLQRNISCCSDRCSCTSRRLDCYVGYRAFSLEDSLEFVETLQPTGGFVAPGTQITVTDSFRTENHFHGVELGFISAYQRQRWTFESSVRVALGNIRQRVRIAGETVVSVPGIAPVVQPYGLLASTSNIGEFERDRFGVLTDTQLELGYWLNCRWKLKVGYNLLFLNSVVRPGDQIDTVVNATQLDPLTPVTGPARPAFDFVDDSLFLHGINVGAEFRF